MSESLSPLRKKLLIGEMCNCYYMALKRSHKIMSDDLPSEMQLLNEVMFNYLAGVLFDKKKQM